MAREVLGSRGRLIIAGDFIDFTGMAKPVFGHREFFEELFPASALTHPEILEALAFTDPHQQLSKIRSRFSGLTSALSELAHARKLVLVPGNHDCCFRDVALRREIESWLEVDESSIEWSQEVRVGDTAHIEHGHQFDPSNRTDQHCYSRGVAITSSLYNAMMPALRIFGVPREIVSAVPAVRPEEIVIHGIQHHLGERDARRLIQAFVALITRNGYFHGWKRALLTPLLHRVPVMTDWMRDYLTPDHFLAAMPNESGLRKHVQLGGERLQASIKPPVKKVILGHTHEMDESPTYMNLGTWIDHLTGMSLEKLEAVDGSLPVLKVDETGGINLYDASELLEAGEVSSCRRIFGQDS